MRPAEFVPKTCPEYMRLWQFWLQPIRRPKSNALREKKTEEREKVSVNTGGAQKPAGPIKIYVNKWETYVLFIVSE